MVNGVTDCIASSQSKLAAPSTQYWFYRQQKLQEFRESSGLTPSFQKATEARQGQMLEMPNHGTLAKKAIGT